MIKHRDWFISRVSGDDSWSCDQLKPCKTIWRAVTLASRGDHIHLDGNNTDKDPYTCQLGTSEQPGIYINKSLTFVGSTDPMPLIRCSNGSSLTFNGIDKAKQMNVVLSRLRIKESFLNVQESSLYINGCKLEGSKQGIKVEIRTSVISSIQITNSIFSRNRECISIIVNSTNNPSQNIPVIFKLKNSSFDNNALSDEGKCISFTEYNNQSVSLDFTLENVIFSHNKFSSRGLIFLYFENGKQNVHFQRVTFIDNSPLSSRDGLTVDGGFSECIIRSTAVDIYINASNISSHDARSFNVSARDISFQVFNSVFCNHRVQGNGGIVSIRGTNNCKLNVFNSLLVNTTAAQGGAINIECTKFESISITNSNFTGNKAMFGGGGAVYINASGSISSNFECAANNKSERYFHSQSKGYLQVSITKCDFADAYSYFGGGAVLINNDLETLSSDLVLSINDSRFIGCSAPDGGSLALSFVGPINITINNSLFISNIASSYGGVLMFIQSSRTPANGLWWSMASQILIQCSTFTNNTAFKGGVIYAQVNNRSILILQQVVMETNRAHFSGGVAEISPINTIKILKSRFLMNSANTIGGAFWIIDMHNLEVVDSLFDSNYVSNLLAGAFGIQTSLSLRTITIAKTTFHNCSSASEGGALYLEHAGNLSLVIKHCRFLENRVIGYPGVGGAIYLGLALDNQKDPGCIKTTLTSERLKNSDQNYPTWDYKSHLTIEDTTFDGNIASIGGAVFLTNGKLTFKNCNFFDNLVSTQGGHIYTEDGSASLSVQSSLFRQTLKKVTTRLTSYDKGSFIHFESSGALKIYNTSVDARPFGSANPLLLVTNGRQMDFGNDNLTILSCPVGSQMDILNSVVTITTRVNNSLCKIEVSTFKLSCLPCTGNSYSLQRGRVIGSKLLPGFQCLPCPFGANCSTNILAQPNFWGYEEMVNPPTLKFTICPLHYCSPPKITEFPKYNGCQGNRSGELCGQCSESYTETLYSVNCRPTHECKDYWFWPVAFLYVLVMALYFTFKPPIMPWIKRQILWFNIDELDNQGDTFDKGYLKIIFYFYQAANSLLVVNSSQILIRTKLFEPLVGLFNFQQQFSSNGFICPFPGLSVVTKQLFSVSLVFCTLIMIGAFYILACGVRKFRAQGAPSAAPFISGILQTMLLGYTTIGSASLSLLRCVPIGSEKRLFLDGSVLCFQWWQYGMIAFMCAFFVPFVFVLFWGSIKLYSGTLSVRKFLLACCFPLPSLIYWSFLLLFLRSSNAVNYISPRSQLSKNSIERVLYDPFKRPEDRRNMSLSWESVMIGRRLILVVLKAFINDPMARLLIMSFVCVLFLLHHALIHPFRDGVANTVETLSLLSLVALAIVNVFFGSLLSFAVPVNDNFNYWKNVCTGLEVVILGFVPTLFGLLLVAALLSQLCRLTVKCVCRVFCLCLGYSNHDDQTRQLLVPVS